MHNGCRNVHWLLSLEDSKEKIGYWRQEYNRQRLYSSLKNKTPEVFVRSLSKVITISFILVYYLIINDGSILHVLRK
ncbi:integrase core domain-containing protein [Morganella morganii]|uniref:integrase core domain-containing protein n=1 Tax=Morganella morganii TaxID=582 RepID=UPI0009B8D2A6